MRYFILLFSLMLMLPLAAQQGSGDVQCPIVKVEAERLADLNLPRYGHSLLLVNGEPTVIGGHTTNFVPTATIEYFKDGKWNLVPSAFTHDDGCAVELTTGKVLIVGGHKENMGVGQSFEAELYDPVTHASEGFASLDTKRAMASALSLDGSVVIAGNWHHKDAIELYDGKKSFLPVKGVSIGRCTPYILQTAKDDAIIIGGADSIGQQISLPVADRLRGEPIHVPLLETWKLIPGFLLWPSSNCFIGDESKGDYSYLLPVKDDEGQVAIARVTNGEFSILATDVPIPKSCQWGEITYCASLFADRKCQRAYFMGFDSRFIETSESSRLYVVAIDYTAEPAHLTFCYTDPITDFNPLSPIVTPDGDLMLTGGLHEKSYFKPSAATWLIHLSPRAQVAAAGLPWWCWLLGILAIATLAAWLIMHTRVLRPRQGEALRGEGVEVEAVVAPEILVRPRQGEVLRGEGVEVEAVAAPDNLVLPRQGEALQGADTSEGDVELMRRLCRLIEEQRPYLNPNLKVTDIANALGTNRIVLSNCIKSRHNCTFPQFVNTYRVAFAQQMLNSQPGIKLAEVWNAAGFSSESSFYRIFKSIAGTTPNEWKNTNS